MVDLLRNSQAEECLRLVAVASGMGQVAASGMDWVVDWAAMV